MSRNVRVQDLAAMTAYAALVAARVRPGDAILLEGALGAGKTAFARGLLRALTGFSDMVVPSPSFTLVQSYDTRVGPVHHFDLWRLDGPAGLIELGWEEACDAVVVVEWPDRLGALSPAGALVLRFEVKADESRVVTWDGWDGRGL